MSGKKYLVQEWTNAGLAALGFLLALAATVRYWRKLRRSGPAAEDSVARLFAVTVRTLLEPPFTSLSTCLA